MNYPIAIEPVPIAIEPLQLKMMLTSFLETHLTCKVGPNQLSWSDNPYKICKYLFYNPSYLYMFGHL